MQLTMNNDSLGCIKKFQQNEISTRPPSLPPSLLPQQAFLVQDFLFLFFLRNGFGGLQSLTWEKNIIKISIFLKLVLSV